MYSFTTYLSSLLGVIAIVFSNHAQKWEQICCKSVQLDRVAFSRSNFFQNWYFSWSSYAKHILGANSIKLQIYWILYYIAYPPKRCIFMYLCTNYFFIVIEYVVKSNLSIRNFLVALKLFLNATSSLSSWSKWQIGHRKWFLNTNLFLIAKFDCS